MLMSGVRIPGNDESFLCATKAVKGVVLVIETFDVKVCRKQHHELPTASSIWLLLASVVTIFSS